MIILTKNTSDPPDQYSTDEGSVPITTRLTFDGSGTPTEIIATVDEPVYVWANDHTGNIDNYSNVGIEVFSSDAGITWELSLDNTNWYQQISIGIIDVSVSFKTIQVYVRVRAINDGSLITNNYVTAKLQLVAVSNPI